MVFYLILKIYEIIVAYFEQSQEKKCSVLTTPNYLSVDIYMSNNSSSCLEKSHFDIKIRNKYSNQNLNPICFYNKTITTCRLSKNQTFLKIIGLEMSQTYLIYLIKSSIRTEITFTTKSSFNL